MKQETTNDHISENKNAAEVREVAADLRGRLTNEEFTNLMKPVDLESCASFAFDWTAIMASVFAVTQLGPWADPVLRRVHPRTPGVPAEEVLATCLPRWHRCNELRAVQDASESEVCCLSAGDDPRHALKCAGISK